MFSVGSLLACESCSVFGFLGTCADLAIGSTSIQNDTKRNERPLQYLNQANMNAFTEVPRYLDIIFIDGVFTGVLWSSSGRVKRLKRHDCDL